MLPSWFKRLPIFSLLFTYIFVCSGLIVAVALVLLSVVLWPVSKNAYRRVSTHLGYTVLGQFVWISHDWAGIKVRLFGDKKTYEMMSKEFSLFTLSHRGDLDWVAGYIVAAQFNFLHTIRTLPKKSVQYVPGFGQILWALECPFLSRSFAKDEIAIKHTTEIYKNYPFPIQVSIFCEGTRFTQAKYQEGVQYAKNRGLPVFKHHLVPRTKGFAVLAHYLKTKAHFPALYDIGFAYPGTTHTPNFLDLLTGRPLTIFLYTRRIPMEEIPSTQEDLNKYCYQLYKHKDDAYDYFVQHGTYPAPEYTKPFSSRLAWTLRLIMLFWFLLLVVLPSVLMVSFLSWAALSLVVVASLFFSVLLTAALLKYSYQPMGVPASPKKTN